MNEYYLNNADYDERLYTMCHEVSVAAACVWVSGATMSS